MSQTPETDGLSWPEPPDLSNAPGAGSPTDAALLARYQAELNAVLAQRAAATASREAELQEVRAATRAQLEAEDKRRDAFLGAYLDVGRATMERMLKRADNLATAATAMGTIYGTALGLAFSLKDGRPLTLLGLVPMIFIGGSLMLVGIYLGFVRSAVSSGRPMAAGSGPRADQNRLNTYIGWVNSMAMARSWALQAAVIALGVGLVTIPLPFLFPG